MTAAQTGKSCNASANREWKPLHEQLIEQCIVAFLVIGLWQLKGRHIPLYNRDSPTLRMLRRDPL